MYSFFNAFAPGDYIKAKKEDLNHLTFNNKIFNMKSKLFFSAICFLLIAACNNSASDKEKKEDTAMKAENHNPMDHPTTMGTVPAMPAIPADAKVVFSNLKDNATITSPFKLQMGTEVIKIDTAGPVVAGSGHHHLLINAGDSIPTGEIVPKDSAHIHFGKGQKEYELNLSPGKYRLTLQMADGLHRSYGGKLASSVTVTVKK